MDKVSNSPNIRQVNFYHRILYNQFNNKAKAFSAELLELNLKNKLKETGKSRKKLEETGRNREKRKQLINNTENGKKLKETTRNRKKW